MELYAILEFWENLVIFLLVMLAALGFMAVVIYAGVKALEFVGKCVGKFVGRLRNRNPCKPS